MKKNALQWLLYAVLLGIAATMPARAAAVRLKPYIMGNPPPDGMSVLDIANLVELQLASQGFDLAGSYSPYPSARVIIVTDRELKEAAARAKNGGFGVAEHVAVTEVDGKIQVSYVNPAYMGVAYGLGELKGVTAMLKAALGDQFAFGSKKGIRAQDLGPGEYHYMMGMPYFNDVDYLATYPSYAVGVATVERNLAAHAGGTVKVYEIRVPGKQVTVFGVGINKGAHPHSDAKNTDKKIMDVIDYGPNRATAFLPYEMMVQGNRAIALPGRYRIAVFFPDTSMIGDHGFTNIMSAPGAILDSLTDVAKPSASDAEGQDGQ
ncbi:MAG: hypothetical protein ACYDHY_16350 [Acidiferrobacterales bacterium]